MPQVELTTSLPTQGVDALVLGVMGGDEPSLATAIELPDETRAHLLAAMSALHLTGKADEVTPLVSVPGVGFSSVVLTGIAERPGSASIGDGPGDGSGGPDAFERLRRAAGAALRSLQGKAATVAVALPSDSPAALRAATEGAVAGCYRYSERITEPGIATVTMVSGCGDGDVARNAMTAGSVVSRQRALACDLVNLPPNMLNPQTFVDRIRDELTDERSHLQLDVLDEQALVDGGFGGIVGVGQGSTSPPRLATLSYEPPNATQRIALIGKGITFDSGGLHLKPIDSMVWMKTDMAGAAVVAASVLAAADLKLGIAVTGYLALAENMISGGAQRPSDVVTMRNGTTVEVLDPDAEGRMVMADALAYASEKSPDALIDVATLTGAQNVALGNRVAAVMANQDAFRDRVLAAAHASGEGMWPIPLVADYRPWLDTPVADIAHKASASGGMITAGLFLSEFIGVGIPWAHLDIAGPGRSDSAYGHTVKGATGFGVPTVVRFLESCH